MAGGGSVLMRKPPDEELYSGWERFERHARANGSADRVEVIWVKPAGVSMATPQTFGQGSFVMGVA